VSKSGQKDKPFTIPKQLVWEAYKRVKANKGAAGVDRVSMEGFEEDLRGNLYKIWNRMSSGSYFPPPVLAVEIPKPHGEGTRVLGVPTVADRVAQTVVARRLEKSVEPIFHPDSYGYRPGRSALDAVGTCRKRCWKADWVIDLDIQKFFDSVPWDLVVKAVEANTDLPWVVLYVKRWLEAPVALPTQDDYMIVMSWAGSTPEGRPAARCPKTLSMGSQPRSPRLSLHDLGASCTLTYVQRYSWFSKPALGGLGGEIMR
jgi:retron-type reverse transcriptase